MFDKPEVRLLERVMSALSEDCYCATWMYDCEYALWSDLMGGEAGGRKGWGISAEDREELGLVHRLAGGWIVWSDEERDLVFLTVEEWLAHLARRIDPEGNDSTGESVQ